MRDWPYLVVSCSEADAQEADDWLLLRLAPEAAAGGYRGCRQEAGSGGRWRFLLTFADAAARQRGAGLLAVTDEPAPASLTLEENGMEPDLDWVARIEATVKPIDLGEGYTALPAPGEPGPGRIGLRVPRGRAFGTGEHASTQLAAALVERWVEAGTACLDLGAGTGLLAALACKAGADPVLAVEVDETACTLAARTRSLNQTPFALVCGTLECLESVPRFRLQVANIERDVLLDLLPGLAARCLPGGHVMLAGLLQDQLDDVAAAAQALGLLEQARPQLDGWGALHLVSRPAALPRAVVEKAGAGAAVTLSVVEAHHLVRVRRTRPGAVVEVVDGQGGAWVGRLQGDGRTVAGLSPRGSIAEPHFQVEIWQGLLHQAGRMEAAIRAAAELGATCFVPLISSRCQGGVKRAGRGRQRWQRVADEAVKQCGRSRAPRIEEPVALADLLERPLTPALALILDPGGWRTAVLPPPPVPGLRLLVGPEGGFSGDEVEQARRHGFLPWRLGPRILRAETAAAAALAVAQARWGDLGGGV